MHPRVAAIGLITLLLCCRVASAEASNRPGAVPDWRWNDRAAEQLLALVQTAGDDGLDPGHYAADELLNADRSSASDALRSRVLLRLASDIHLGRVDPQRFSPELAQRAPDHPEHLVLELAAAVEQATLPDALAALRPRSPLYRALQIALADYRRQALQGGWPTIPPGPSLHPGDQSDRIALLRARLRASHDLRGPATPADPDTYDEALAAAVRHFQQRHQLEADAIVGLRTLAALNVPIRMRIEQIRVNLERARWLLQDLPDDYVLVDIAGFELHLVRGGIESLASRVVVGKPYRRTPMFRSAISYLDFAPSWTVPPTILRNDVLPAIRKDPAYLAKRHMRLLDHDGNSIDPAGVDWSRYTGSRLPPFMVRQESGPENPLGRVKFMFPNRHHVYLHDTPQRELFERSERAFSSGCIRVEKAADLAELLLGAQGWSAEQVAAALALPETRRVRLERPIPVLLYYWTASREDDGDIVFRSDIYAQDAALLRALDEVARP